eukprot:264348-Rhodomonas_salina.3
MYEKILACTASLVIEVCARSRSHPMLSAGAERCRHQNGVERRGGGCGSDDDENNDDHDRNSG